LANNYRTSITFVRTSALKGKREENQERRIRPVIKHAKERCRRSRRLKRGSEAERGDIEKRETKRKSCCSRLQMKEGAGRGTQGRACLGGTRAIITLGEGKGQDGRAISGGGLIGRKRGGLLKDACGLQKKKGLCRTPKYPSSSQ